MARYLILGEDDQRVLDHLDGLAERDRFFKECDEPFLKAVHIV